jgi:acyl-CoA synthetase (AMP-forming)/AMP-acid ligase II
MNPTILSLLSAEALRRNYGAEYWRDETIYALARSHAARAPDRFAIRDQFRRLTYRGLVDRADALARHLVSHGVRAGERVVSWLPSRIEAAIIQLACSRQGYVFCPSPHRNHTVADVVDLLECARCAALFYQPGFGADASKVDIAVEVGKLPSLRRVHCIEPLAPKAPAPFVDLPAGGETESAGMPVNREPDRVSYLAFTSGSTGAPKGVMHSDNTLLAALRMMAADWDFGPDTVTYSLSPFSHNLGAGAWLTSLVAGGEFVVHDLPQSASLIDRLVETGTSYLVGVPTHAIALVEELRRRGSGGLDHLRCFRISGAPAPGLVIEELLRFGIEPQSGYGMTENCAHQYTRPGDDPRRIIETCGKACAGYEVGVFDTDDADRPAKPGAIGEIGGRGASLMLGYFGDQASTESCFNADGWFMTGDLGWLDEEGYLRITGRKKDVIIRGGHNINPARIEDLAMRHPVIERAAAIPVTDERLGERICLVVMFRPGQAASVEQILNHLDAAGLSKYEMPEFYAALAEIPLMPSGKIQKLDLARWLHNGQIVPQPVRPSGTA